MMGSVDTDQYLGLLLEKLRVITAVISTSSRSPILMKVSALELRETVVESVTQTRLRISLIRAVFSISILQEIGRSVRILRIKTLHLVAVMSSIIAQRTVKKEEQL